MVQYIHTQYKSHLATVTLTLLVLFVFMSKTVQSENFVVEPSLENANWRILTDRSKIKAIALSNNGEILWAGSEGGLEQWDAKQRELIKFFQNQNGLPSNHVISLLVDNNDEVWVGTDQGLACLDNKGHWHQFDADDGLRKDNNIIKTLLTDNEGKIWIGTMEGVFHRNDQCDDKFKPLFNKESLEGHIEALLIDERGQLWAGTQTKGLARRNPDGSWTHYTRSEYPTSNHITALAMDGSGGLWLGTGYDEGHGYAGLLHFNGESFQSDPINSDIGSANILTLLPDKQGTLWIGTANGLFYRNAEGRWKRYDKTDGLPSDGVTALVADNNNGLWVGSGYYETEGKGGLAYHPTDSNEWIKMTSYFTAPANNFFALLSDDNGGLWVGSGSIGNLSGQGGLGYYSADGRWKIYTPQNSLLPSRKIKSLAFAGGDGLWVGTEGSGLARLTISNEHWDVMTSPQLPHNNILSLASDPNGVWIGTLQGLAYRSVNDEWQIFNGTNSLPILEQAPISSLLMEADGGLWVGIFNPYSDIYPKNGGNLVYRSKTGEWTDHSNILPYNSVRALAPDGNGGLWVGTQGGLIHCSANKECREEPELEDEKINALLSIEGNLWIGTFWKQQLIYRSATGAQIRFNRENSPLPMDTINAFALDKTNGLWNGGLWIGGASGGLVHLSFGNKQAICNAIHRANKTDPFCSNDPTAQPVAILIHPNGRGTGYKQEEAVNAMARHIYRTLLGRGYTNESIYLLSHQDDFNLNPTAADQIVDQSAKVLTDEHIRAAFEWAKSKGQLDYPLLVAFVDHGRDGELLLDPDPDPDHQQTLTAREFKILLDDYQNHTNNSVVVILEACHTGTLINTLARSDRLIISSTDDNKAYYYDVGHISFTTFYFDELLRNKSFQDALESVKTELAKYNWPFNLQKPQFNGPKELLEQCLNRCIIDLDGKPIIIKFENPLYTASVDIPFELTTLNIPEAASEVYAKAMVKNDFTNKDGYFESEVEANSVEKTTDNQWKIRFKFSEEHKYANYTVFIMAKNNEDEIIGESETIEIIVNELPPLGKSAETTFTGGTTVDGQTYQVHTQVPLSQSVDIIGKMEIDDLHLNQPADIVAFATYLPEPNNPNNKLFYMLDSNGVPVSWDGDMAHLMVFKQVNLPKHQKVAIYNGGLVPGNLKISFGYRLPDGTVIVNETPIEVDALM